MSDEENSKPSFSLLRRCGIVLDLALRTAVVLAIVVMVNYLGTRWFKRVNIGAHSRLALSARTTGLLKSLTNDVKVTLFYDKEDAAYPTIAALLDEYHNIATRITVVTVDYTRDAVEAQRVKAAYKLGANPDAPEKNIVIFDCEGRTKIADGKSLSEYKIEEVPNEKEREFRRRPVAFNGEMMFTSMLLAVVNPKPLKAYFLQGHGEHQPDSDDELSGYAKFAAVLQQNYVQIATLPLLGTNPVPADCDLLIIAGAATRIPDEEMEGIEKFLEDGGRMFAAVNSFARNKQTGVEKILARWGVVVGAGDVRDPDATMNGQDLIVGNFGRHPVVNPLLGSSRLHMILPRSVRALESHAATDAPKAVELAFTGPRAVASDDPAREPHRYPVAVAVEKGAVRGVVTERGATRIVAVGDSFFLASRQIDSAGNRDFVGYAANWLLDRPQLLEGLGPKPVTEFRLNMTRKQLWAVEWLLLGGIPGVVLAFGALVWLRRRS